MKKTNDYKHPVADIKYFSCESVMSSVWSGEREIDLEEDVFSSTNTAGSTEP